MINWIVCLFKGHDWKFGIGKYTGEYCSRCGIWEYDR